MEVELQSQMEHDEYDSYLRPDLYALSIRNGAEPWKMRGYQKSSQDVSQYQRLLYSFEHYGDYSSRQKYDGQIADECRYMHKLSSGSLPDFLLL